MNIMIAVILWILASAFLCSGFFGICASTIAYRVFAKDNDRTGIMMVLVSFLCDAIFLTAAVMLMLAALQI